MIVIKTSIWWRSVCSVILMRSLLVRDQPVLYRRMNWPKRLKIANLLTYIVKNRPRPRGLAPTDYITPPDHLVKAEKEWLSFGLSPSIESCKERAIYTYQSQIHSPELSGLMKGNIRKNEIFAIPNLQ